MYLDTANNVTVGIGRMLPNSQAGYNLGFTKTHHIPRGHGDSEDVEISASHGDIDSAFNATKEKGIQCPSLRSVNGCGLRESTGQGSYHPAQHVY